MKAILSTRSSLRDGLQLREIPQPIARENELLVKVHAGTVTAGDVLLQRARFPFTLILTLFGTPKKKIPGHEFAGQIEAIGGAITGFKPGDLVFGTTTGLRTGASAEYVAVPGAGVKGLPALMPKNLSFEEAAALPVGGMTALQILYRGKIQQARKVLIYGASGSVGTYAVQIARHFGADVTAVCGARNAALVRSLGAREVLDYAVTDFTERDVKYDLILDAVGKASPERSKRTLTATGAFVSVRSTTSEKPEYLEKIRELAEFGAIRPVIDRRYALAQTPEAYRYVTEGRKTGNVVIRVA